MYVVGDDLSPGNYQWRIEKRNLSDGILVNGFGTGGIVTSNPSAPIAPSKANAIAIDSTYMYVVGNDYALGKYQWRIEKRNLSDGVLVSGFDMDGVVTGTANYAYDISIDTTYMYVVGWDYTPGNWQWRIEKRNLSDGVLVSGFGTGGIVTSNPSAYFDVANAIKIDSTYMYVAGRDETLGDYKFQWRIEKRSLVDGSLDTSFGTGGIITSNPTSYDELLNDITIDSQYLYAFGFDDTKGSPAYQWRMEKRSLLDGSLVPTFGIGGTITSGNPVCYRANSITLDSTYIYAVGADWPSSYGQWRIEKRLK
jgi:hypothetical protein